MITVPRPEEKKKITKVATTPPPTITNIVEEDLCAATDFFSFFDRAPPPPPLPLAPRSLARWELGREGTLSKSSSKTEQKEGGGGVWKE